MHSDSQSMTWYWLTVSKHPTCVFHCHACREQNGNSICRILQVVHELLSVEDGSHCQRCLQDLIKNQKSPSHMSKKELSTWTCLDFYLIKRGMMFVENLFDFQLAAAVSLHGFNFRKKNTSRCRDIFWPAASPRMSFHWVTGNHYFKSCTKETYGRYRQDDAKKRLPGQWRCCWNT